MLLLLSTPSGMRQCVSGGAKGVNGKYSPAMDATGDGVVREWFGLNGAKVKRESQFP